MTLIFVFRSDSDDSTNKNSKNIERIKQENVQNSFSVTSGFETLQVLASTYAKNKDEVATIRIIQVYWIHFTDEIYLFMVFVDY